jgi:hypothetical protein
LAGGIMKLTHGTPHSPTLITAGVKYDKNVFDIFIGGKFKGVKCSIERHYGSARARKTTQNAALSTFFPPSVTGDYIIIVS